MSKKLTLQENFWKGDFGDQYIKRNKQTLLRTKFWKMILEKVKIKNIYELGTNAGINLDAIKLVDKKIKTNGTEINKKAQIICLKKGHNIELGSIVEKIKVKKKFDFVFTSSVLIHINPNKLDAVYKNINSLSKKYILINEYHSPFPVEVKYRGHKNVLFKRDFAHEIQKKYNYKLIDYGFLWKYDKNNMYPDLNWFLFKKK